MATSPPRTGKKLTNTVLVIALVVAGLMASTPRRTEGLEKQERAKSDAISPAIDQIAPSDLPREVITPEPGSPIQNTIGPQMPTVLRQNVPNPVEQQTSIEFCLGDEEKVQLEILDIAAKRVRLLVDGELEAGEHRVEWNGCNDAGDRIPGGIYFYVLATVYSSATRKLVLLD